MRTWAAAITVETALTIGRFSDWRRIEKTQTGNVCSNPPVKNETSKLLNDQAKAKIPAAASDGAMWGRTTWRIICACEAPRSTAASSTERGKRTSPAEMIATTRGKVTTSCISATVFSDSAIPIWLK
jgi:hypothetical protein